MENRYDIHPTLGFLTQQQPLQQQFTVWENLAARMPQLMAARKLRHAVHQLPVLDIQPLLQDLKSLKRAKNLLSFLVNAYVWEEHQEFCDIVPEALSYPLLQVCDILETLPIITHQDLVLGNWKYLFEDYHEPLVDNIETWFEILGGLDESWFYRIMVDLEYKGGPIAQLLLDCIEAVESENDEILIELLKQVLICQEGMADSLVRMTERCDTLIFNKRIRRYVSGWKTSAYLPNGVLYQGAGAITSGYLQQFVVESLEDDEKGIRMKLNGGSAAQSALIPSLDCAFGVLRDMTQGHGLGLSDLRLHMPKPHREFLEHLSQNPLRPYIAKSSNQHLKEIFNDNIMQLYEFRNRHIPVVHAFIIKHASKDDVGDSDVSTIVPFLKCVRKDLDGVLLD